MICFPMWIYHRDGHSAKVHSQAEFDAKVNEGFGLHEEINIPSSSAPPLVEKKEEASTVVPTPAPEPAAKPEKPRGRKDKAEQ